MGKTNLMDPVFSNSHRVNPRSPSKSSIDTYATNSNFELWVLIQFAILQAEQHLELAAPARL
ncbi:hypothetical protein Lepto7375DRAFT_7119 [Leptolyngbya sp. PCC 7375]|nr:hypothetical protein Lepto7375DRAFT_7119 [Leptolyngbya sp. PCC 7375]